MRRSRNVTRRVARRSKVARRSRVARRTAKVARKRRSNTRKVSKRNRRNNTRRVRRGGADAAVEAAAEREKEADRQFAEFQDSLRRQQMPGEPAADPQQRGRAHRTTRPAMRPEEYASLNPYVPISRVAYNPTGHALSGLSGVASAAGARRSDEQYFFSGQ